MARLVARWLILSVNEIYDNWLGRSNLITLTGSIKESNFLLRYNQFNIPALREIGDVAPGDLLRITYYAYEKDIENQFDGNIVLALADKGLRYELFINDAWNLLYEDLEPI